MLTSSRLVAGRRLRLSFVLALVAVVLCTTRGVASADPQPTENEIQLQLERLGQRIDTVVEHYNRTQLQLDDSRERVGSLRQRIAEQERDVARLRDEMGAIAAAAYRSGGMSGVAAILAADDPGAAVRRAATLRALARDREARLRDIESKIARLRHQKMALRRILQKRAHVEEELAKRKQVIERKIGKQQALLDELREPAYDTAVPAGATYTGPATGSAREAVEFAYAQLGKAYAWGAAGPDAYDCSGLTMAAWAAGGVSLPHSSGAQFSAGPHVAMSDLRAGDLLFFGQPTIHHVGIYVGNGQMIHSPHSGSVVQRGDIDSGWYAQEYVGAVRP